MQQNTAKTAKTCQNVAKRLARANFIFVIRTHILTHFVLSLRSITSFVPMFRPTSSTHFVRLLVRTCVSHSLRSFESSFTSFTSIRSLTFSLTSFVQKFVRCSLTSFVRRYRSHFVRTLSLTSFVRRSLRSNSLTSFVHSHFVRMI